MSKKGYPWTEKEEDALREEYLVRGISVDTIAEFHSRTIGGIQGRLQKLAIPLIERHLFVLALNNDCFFIGVTLRPKQLLHEYIIMRQKGQNLWLDQNPVITVVEQYEMKSLFELDAKVKYYMYYKGLNRVRGGSYSSPILSEAQLLSLKAELSFIYQEDQCSLLTI